MTSDPERDGLLANFYGLYLRQRGYSPERAAELVARLYPALRRQLQELASRKERKEHEAAATAAAGGAAC